MSDLDKEDIIEFDTRSIDEVVLLQQLGELEMQFYNIMSNPSLHSRFYVNELFDFPDDVNPNEYYYSQCIYNQKEVIKDRLKMLKFYIMAWHNSNKEE